MTVRLTEDEAKIKGGLKLNLLHIIRTFTGLLMVQKSIMMWPQQHNEDTI